MHCIESVDVFHSRQRFQTQTGDLACSAFFKKSMRFVMTVPCPTLWVHVSVAIVLHYAL